MMMISTIPVGQFVGGLLETTLILLAVYICFSFGHASSDGESKLENYRLRKRQKSCENRILNSATCCWA